MADRPLSQPDPLAFDNLMRAQAKALHINDRPPVTRKDWLERRLRDLGLLVGVNDAESMKQLRPRFASEEVTEEAAHVPA